MTAEDLRKIIEAEIAKSGDLTEVAESVARRIPGGEVRSALALTLPSYLHHFVTTKRANLLNGPLDESPPPAQPGPSRRVTAVAAWIARLEAPIGVADNQIRRLGDCTIDDVRFQVAKLDSQIAALRERSAFFARIAEAMQATGVATVGQLPQPTLVTLLDEAA